MKQIRALQIVTAAVLVYMAIFSADPAQAALYTIYEGKAKGASSFTAAMVSQAPAYSQATAKDSAQRSKTAMAGVKQVSQYTLAQKYVKFFEKEQETFYKTFMDAEMALRYMYSQYRGGKEPSEEEFKAMKFATELLIKDMQSSAKRYASNLRMAKMAMLQMDEKERTFFAKHLAAIFAAPAYAGGTDTDALDTIANAFGNISSATTNIDSRTMREVMNARQAKNEAEAARHLRTSSLYTAAIIGSSVAKVATTAVGTLTGMMTGGPIGGTAAFVGGVTQMTVDVVELTDEIKEASGQRSTKTQGQKNVIDTLKTVSTISNVVNTGAGIKDLPDAVKNAATKKEKTLEITKAVIETVSTAESVLEELTNIPDKPGAPGSSGVNAVKEAKRSVGSSGGGGSGGGGGCSGGCS